MGPLGYWVIKDMNCLPPMLGGTGHLSNWANDLPAWEKPQYFDVLFMISAGFFLEDLVEILVCEKKKDFTEMLAHHISTLVLIFFAHTINLGAIGYMILWTHYWADIFVYIARGMSEIKDHILPVIAYVGMITVWPYTRMYAFLYIIYEVNAVKLEDYGGLGLKDPKLSLDVLIGLLVVLYVLHWYWYYKIL